MRGTDDIHGKGGFAAPWVGEFVLSLGYMRMAFLNVHCRMSTDKEKKKNEGTRRDNETAANEV